MTTEKKCVGYKMTRTDGTAFYDSRSKYEVGRVLSLRGATEDGKPCGVGLHLAKEKHGPMKYNAVWPWRLFECEYSQKDVVGEDESKVRVKQLKVVREIDPKDIGLPRAEQFFDRLERLQKYEGMKAQTPARKKNIKKAVHEYVRRLNAHPAANGRVVECRKVVFHSVVEWGSVWGSVWDSVRDSVWGSVRDSVWDSVWGSVRDSVWGSVWGSVWDSVRDSVWDSVWGSVRDSVRGAVWDSVWGSVRDSVWDSVRGSVWDSVWGSVSMDDTQSPFLLEHDILDYGAVLYGIDMDGVAHVIMPTKEEIEHDR